MRQRQVRERTQAGRRFRRCRLEEFQARGRVVEEVADLDHRARFRGHLQPLRDLAPLAAQTHSARRAARAARHREARHRADGGEGFAAKAERSDGVQILVARQLGRGVTLERQRHLRRRHSDAVIGDADERNPAVAQIDGDHGRRRVERVLDELLDG
jgi:hypothetical protein